MSAIYIHTKHRNNSRVAQRRGFTLIELMIVVVIVGVLAALASYGVRKYVASAKTTEARNAIGQMAKDASTAYARDNMNGTVLAFGGTVVASSSLCLSASATVPAVATSIKGQKYQSSPSEWSVDAATPGTGFACLHFSIDDPQYFLYRYKTSATAASDAGKVGTTYDAIAQGDLDGDGVLSEIKLTGLIAKDAKGKPSLTTAPNFTETNPDE